MRNGFATALMLAAPRFSGICIYNPAVIISFHDLISSGLPICEDAAIPIVVMIPKRSPITMLLVSRCFFINSKDLFLIRFRG